MHTHALIRVSDAMTKRHLDVRPLMEKLCPPHNVAGTRQCGVGWILSVVRNSEVFISLLFKHRPNNKSSGDWGTSARTELSASSAISNDDGLSWVVGRWVGRWVGVVEMAERWQILLEPRVCHSFQLEENKSICEAATGAERTFREPSVFTRLAKEPSACVCMRTCADERALVCVCLSVPFRCLAGWFNRCFGCHWLTQLVIIRLHSDTNWATYHTLAKCFHLFSCFIRARPKLNTKLKKMNKQIHHLTQHLCIIISLCSQCPFSFSLATISRQ